MNGQKITDLSICNLDTICWQLVV